VLGFSVYLVLYVFAPKLKFLHKTGRYVKKKWLQETRGKMDYEVFLVLVGLWQNCLLRPQKQRRVIVGKRT
jgi:hypothetical protein